MDQTALITGASSGIGLELSRLFARDRYQLVLVARDSARLAKAAERLRAEYGVRTVEIAVDLADIEAPNAIYEKLRAANITVDVLVNGAGLGYGGPFHANTIEQETEVLQVNVLAAVRLTRLLVPGFVKRRRGRILNIASLAGFAPGPFFANYYATKGYVLSFSEALAVELKPYGVTVTALCPGTTRTGFHRKAGIERTDLAKGMLGVVSPPESVALSGYRALMKGKTVVIPGLVNQVSAFLVRVAPRQLVTLITAQINRIRPSEPGTSATRSAEGDTNSSK
jgi:short-subunit dehydrogenase